MEHINNAGVLCMSLLQTCVKRTDLRLTRLLNMSKSWLSKVTRGVIMPYTVKPKSNGFGSFGVLAGDAHEALNIVKGLAERGIEEIEILDDSGAKCDPVELERIAGDAELAR
jgi:hypothetical protein